MRKDKTPAIGVFRDELFRAPEYTSGEPFYDIPAAVPEGCPAPFCAARRRCGNVRWNV